MRINIERKFKKKLRRAGVLRQFKREVTRLRQPFDEYESLGSSFVFNQSRLGAKLWYEAMKK